MPIYETLIVLLIAACLLSLLFIVNSQLNKLIQIQADVSAARSYFERYGVKPDFINPSER